MAVAHSMYTSMSTWMSLGLFWMAIRLGVAVGCRPKDGTKCETQQRVVFSLSIKYMNDCRVKVEESPSCSRWTMRIRHELLRMVL
jgi:hypothetical protein